MSSRRQARKFPPEPAALEAAAPFNPARKENAPREPESVREGRFASGLFHLARHLPAGVVGVQQLVRAVRERRAQIVLVEIEDIRVLVREAQLVAAVEEANRGTRGKPASLFQLNT